MSTYDFEPDPDDYGPEPAHIANPSKREHMNYDIKTTEGMANSVAWTATMFSMMRDGALWAVPRSMMMLKIYPSKKEVEVTRGHTADASIEEVIKAMGWTVTVK